MSAPHIEVPQHYKVLVNGRSCHGGALGWSLPRQDGEAWKPGGWHTYEGEIIVCRQGLHTTTNPHNWLKQDCQIYLAETAGRGEQDEDQPDKWAHERVRLLRECPDMVPAWWREHEAFVRDAIPATPWCQPDGNPDPAWRLFTAPTLAAAWSAAWSAAESAARSAARSAAESAAESAAWNAAWSAAWSAARSAARSAAWSAARSAAWSAARSAAESAAESAARSAALYTQVQHICGDLEVEQRHRDYAVARWHAWQKGYCVLTDVDGVLYVYAQEP